MFFANYELKLTFFTSDYCLDVIILFAKVSLFRPRPPRSEGFRESWMFIACFGLSMVRWVVVLWGAMGGAFSDKGMSRFRFLAFIKFMRA